MAAQEINKGANKEEDELEKEDQMTDFREETGKTDLVIIVEGKKLHFVKNILSMASPVFDRMFQSDSKELEKVEIEMPGKKLEDVILFLQRINPKPLKPITFETAMRILPFIEEYQVLQLKTICEKVICDAVNEDTTTEMLYQILNTACTYGLENVREKCVGLASIKSAKDSELAKKKYPLPDAVMNKILTLKIEDLEKSNEILQRNVSSLEEKMEIMSSNTDLFTEYFAGDLFNNTKQMPLDLTRNWKENKVLMKVDSESLRATCNIVVGDAKFVINANESPGLDKRVKYLSLSVVIEDYKDSFITDVKVKIILLNGESNSKNFSCVVEGQIRPNNREVFGYVEKKSTIKKNKKNGFIQERNIWMLLQLFMSEPITL